MPLSDPYSSYLDRLARQRAEDELMRSRLGEASKQFQGGLGQWNDALRIQKADTRQTEQDTAAAAERAEGLRLRKAQDAREAERAKREADEAARIAAQRPIEEARAAEDRAFTLRQREISTADAARKAAIERIKALPPQTAMGDDVDVHGLIVQTGAAGGLTPDEALGVYRDAQQARTDARRTADLEARAKEAQIKKAGRVPGGGGGAPKPQTSDPLRKEFNALPAVKNYNEASVAYDKMQRAANSESPAGDLSLIFNLMKTLDPTSTVRESEFAAAARAGDFGDQVATTVTKVTSGERLTPSQRRDFLKQAEGFLAAHKSAYDRETERYSSLATGRKVAPADVVGLSPSAPTANVPDDNNW